MRREIGPRAATGNRAAEWVSGAALIASGLQVLPGGPRSVKSSAFLRRTLTSSADVPTLVAMASAAHEIFSILFLVARKPAC